MTGRLERPRWLPPDAGDNFPEAEISDKGEVCGRLRRLAPTNASLVDHGDATTCILEELRGGQSGDSAADHDDIDCHAAFERREIGRG